MSNHTVNGFRPIDTYLPDYTKGLRLCPLTKTISWILSLVAIPIIAVPTSLWYLGKTFQKGVEYLRVISHKPSRHKFDTLTSLEVAEFREKFNNDKKRSMDILKSTAKKLGAWLVFIIPGAVITLSAKKVIDKHLAKKKDK